MIPDFKGINVVPACRKRHFNLEVAKHEEVAIYVVNAQIPNVCRIVKVHGTKQSVGIMNYRYKFQPTTRRLL